MTEHEISKFLSYLPRHAPDSIGLTLDASGWADVSGAFGVLAGD